MRNDWIAFYHNGAVRVDVVLQWGQDELYPQNAYAMTPHYGKVDMSFIIETRAATTPDAQGGDE